MLDLIKSAQDILDLEFYFLNVVTIIEYDDGDCVPGEIGCLRCTIRDGIQEELHFFPDPGPLR